MAVRRLLYQQAGPGIRLSVSLDLHRPGLAVPSIPADRFTRLTHSSREALHSIMWLCRGSRFCAVATRFRVSKSGPSMVGGRSSADTLFAH